jgi:hypothetical protein
MITTIENHCVFATSMNVCDFNIVTMWLLLPLTCVCKLLDDTVELQLG